MDEKSKIVNKEMKENPNKSLFKNKFLFYHIKRLVKVSGKQFMFKTFMYIIIIM